MVHFHRLNHTDIELYLSPPKSYFWLQSICVDPHFVCPLVRSILE